MRRLAVRAPVLLTWLLCACAVATPAAPSTPARQTHAPAGAQAPARGLRSEPWPEADVLFRSDPRWLGGDAALSVELGPGRVLWLFGDSFVATGDGKGGRRASRMIRNSVAVQHGSDPARASLRFHYRHDEAGLPTSFFPEPPGGFYWPGHGIVLEGTLTLFLHRVVPAPGTALGFRSAGFSVVRVDTPDAPPSAWSPRPLPLPPVAADEVIGAAVLEQDGHVYAARVQEPGDQSLSLVRWRRADFVAGELSGMERWDGRGFGAGPSVPVAARVGTELSLSPTPDGGFVLVHGGDFGASALMVRFAPRLTGPWSAPEVLYRPEEMAREGVLIYAAKAHPELDGAPLVVTYATNTLDADRLLDDASLYYPRFVRAWPW